jgi:hypothetical protein
MTDIVTTAVTTTENKTGTVTNTVIDIKALTAKKAVKLAWTVKVKKTDKE